MNAKPMNAKPADRPARSRTFAPKPILLAGLGLCAVAGVWAMTHTGSRHKTGVANAQSVSLSPASPAVAAPEDVLAGIPEGKGTGATDQAIAQGREKARQNPDKDRIWVGLGDVLVQKARETNDARYYGYAEKVYTQALALKPINPDAMTGLASVKGGLYQLDDSVAWANKALAREPNNSLAYGLLSDAEVERGEYDAAFEHTQKMMDIRPDMSSYSRGATLLFLTGDNRKAQWLMAKAIKAGSPFAENTAWCRVQLAQMLFDDGAIFIAGRIASEALAKNPENVHVLAMMGKIKAAKKEYSAADALYKKALAISPQHSTLVALGDVYAAMGNKDEAAKTYAQVEELHSKNNASGTAHDQMQMAQFYADHDRMPTEAVKLAETHKASSNVFDADILAWAYYKNGQYPQAKEAIDRAMSRHTSDARFYYHAGMIYAKLGNPTVAKRYLYQALSLNGGFSPLAVPLASQALRDLGSVAQNRAPIPANSYPADSSFLSTRPTGFNPQASGQAATGAPTGATQNPTASAGGTQTQNAAR